MLRLADRTKPQVAQLDGVTALFTVAVLLHNADHVRRGDGATPGDVLAVGTLAVVVEVAVVALVFLRHRLAPLAAAAAGFALAAGYVVVHFTPERGWLSDSFLGTGAEVLSIVLAAVEVAAALALGLTALAVLRGDRGRDDAAPRRAVPPIGAVLAAMVAGNAVVLALTFLGD